ncbi:MAG: hypothetical protein HQK52_21230 [Oligoflexia bacterium]|nr:hypothetical protein [Oligoflexia bacterium]
MTMPSYAYLGTWGILDFETTGSDPSFDQIIDVGFIQFEGTRVVKRYSTLVRPMSNHAMGLGQGDASVTPAQTQLPLSNFIKALTGISDLALASAPTLPEVSSELLELFAKTPIILAHNASFEESFAKNLLSTTTRPTFVDTIPLAALLFPDRHSLSLESLITDLHIHGCEQHRGLEDSLDLLKVMLVGLQKLNQQTSRREDLLSLISSIYSTREWIYRFLALSSEQVQELAMEIAFEFPPELQSLSTPIAVKNFSSEFSGNNVKTILQDDLFPSSGELESMALKIGQALKNSLFAIIDTETSPGFFSWRKHAYLVPAILYALNNENEQIVLSSHAHKRELASDVASLLHHFPDHLQTVKSATVPNSKQHFCPSLKDALAKALATDHSNLKDAFAFIFQGKSLNIRYRYPELEMLEALVRCRHHLCPQSENGSCSYKQALEECSKARLLISDHQTLYHWPLSKAHALIIDEGHTLEETSSNESKILLDRKDLKTLFQVAALLLPQEHDLLAECEHTLTALDETFKDLFMMMPKFDPQYWNELSVAAAHKEASLSAMTLITLIDALSYQLSALKEKAANNTVLSLPFVVDDYLSLITEIKIAQTGKSTETLCTYKFHSERGFIIESVAIDLGQHNFKQLFEHASSGILISSLIPLYQTSLDWVSGFRYIPQNKKISRPQSVISPKFAEIANKTTLHICHDIPDSGNKEFTAALLRKLSTCLRLGISRNTLFLFSSRFRFDTAREEALTAASTLPLAIQGLSRTSNSNTTIFFAHDNQYEDEVFFPQLRSKEAITILIDKFPDIAYNLQTKSRRDFYQKNYGNEFNEYFWHERIRRLRLKLERILLPLIASAEIKVIIADSRAQNWKGKSLDLVSEQLLPLTVVKSSIAEAL